MVINNGTKKYHEHRTLEKINNELQTRFRLEAFNGHH